MLKLILFITTVQTKIQKNTKLQLYMDGNEFIYYNYADEKMTKLTGMLA